MRILPQADHADLGLVEDQDRTEDLRPNNRTAPEPRMRQHPARTAQPIKEVTTTTRKATPS